MSTRQIINHLMALVRQRRQLHFLLLSGAASPVLFALLLSVNIIDISLAISLTLVLFVIAQLTYLFLRESISEKQLARYLDLHIPELQNSTELLLKRPVDYQSNPIAKIQRQRVSKQFLELAQQGQLLSCLPRLSTSAIIKNILLGLSLAMALLLLQSLDLSQIINGFSNDISNDPSKESVAESTSLRLTEIALLETPAAYTGKATLTHHSLSTEILESSKVQWRLRFSQPVTSVTLDFVNHPALQLTTTQENIWTGSMMVDKTLVYHLNINEGNQNFDKFRLTLIEDQGPKITIEQPANSITELPLDAAEDVLIRNISASISDDYQITAVNLIVTLAKGGGENVRFRDQIINLFEQAPVNQPATSQSSTNQPSANYAVNESLNLTKLGMTSGDELYFRIESTDNRSPKANISRSGSYIIRWPDPETMASDEMGSMLINLMPDFFRSQRQIIIDTEQLAKERDSISKTLFSNRSQSIAESQKILRLRYGQFLGEEYESGISSNLAGMIASLAEQAMEQDPDLHDDGHGHDHGENAEADKALKINSIMDVMSTFGHIHDLPEQSTLLDEQTKKLLKVALTSMWEAELRLRLIQPVDALPAEYKSLEFIKKAQQSERIYLQRVGFEPPPLKEERRLSGELKGIKSSNETRFDQQNQLQQQYLKVIRMLNQVELGPKSGPKSEPALLQQLIALEQMINWQMKQQPDNDSIYLDSLADLKRLHQQVDCASCRQSLLKSLWKLTKNSETVIGSNALFTDPLSETFRQELVLKGEKQ